MNFASRARGHRQAGDRIRDYLYRFEDVLSDYEAGAITSEEARIKRDELESAVNQILPELPHTTKHDYNRAEDALETNEHTSTAQDTLFKRKGNMTGFVEMFDATLFNLKVGSERAQVIRNRRDEITKALNKGFRDTESAQNNRLMVGSWGRNTAINGVSDLDMIYVLPESLRDETRRRAELRKFCQKHEIIYVSAILPLISRLITW